MTSNQKISPCLWFATEAEEAVRFYVSVFPDSRIDRILINGAGTPKDRAGTVMLVDFTLAGQQYQAMNGGPQRAFNHAISLVVRCTGQDEIDRYWNGLTENGGDVVQGGWLRDRFGVVWQIVPAELPTMLQDRDRRRAARVMAAAARMEKPDLAELRKAYEGRA